MIALATIAHNKPRLVGEQIRLLRKYLTDEFSLTVFDSSTNKAAMAEIKDAREVFGAYVRLPTTQHDEALNAAVELLVDEGDAPYIGFLDHDIFPTQPTTLIDKIEASGFYGVGQRHAPTGHLYLWPGFCFFSREWLAGRSLDFRGIRGDKPADNGDTGSNNWPLFKDEDWSNLYKVDHGYKALRVPDDEGLQSWGYETIDSWVHMSNGSHWKKVPNPEERDRLIFELLATL